MPNTVCGSRVMHTIHGVAYTPNLRQGRRQSVVVVVTGRLEPLKPSPVWAFSFLKQVGTKGGHDAKNKKDDVENKNIAVQNFTFRELAATTKNSWQECLLGEGGFGRVYNGHLENGQDGRLNVLEIE
ncbi:hypothetical protein Syun_017345 [Stephania yunnanensis]|uniref:Uncharacterized protein n=1 Tax=Stephania yunnanensis TaxID=152371 RepID=A0AAP0J6V4_9MAGN